MFNIIIVFISKKMDRAVFLRSLPYLRPLPPFVWVKCLADPTSSCSTGTPSTPGSEGHVVLLDDVVVSIEPFHSCGGRKRDRSDERSEYRPAYFNIYQQADNDKILNVNSSSKADNDARKISNDKINNDPAMCSLEIAIVKKSRIVAILAHENESDMATPIRTTHMEVDSGDDTPESYDSNANALLFRFGNYFLFEVNPAAIVKVEFRAEELVSQNNEGSASSQDDNAHQSKKQRTENGKTSTSIRERCPASLVIYFPSCAFRVFSVDKMGDDVFASAESQILRQLGIGGNISNWSPTLNENTESELWLACLHSRNDKTSSTKADSSSTFEHGQQQLSDMRMNETSKSDNAREEDKNFDSSQSQAIVVNGATTSSEQQSGEQTTSEDSIWLREISRRRYEFDFSWSLVNKSIISNGKPSTLSSSAHSLHQSYTNMKQYSTFSEKCDAEIDNVTKDIQEMIETVMPMRGRGSNGKDPRHSNGVENIGQNINRLLRLRKQAVAAKYALFLIPQK